MARALAETMRAELHYIPSQECNLENLNRIVSICHYKPMSGCKMSLVLIDEADQMSKAAQISLLSTLDNPPPDTIFIFTCNETGRLEDRFLSRVMTVEFSSYGIAREAVTMLGRIWKIEAQGAPEPNFARIVKETNNNIRASLMKLQTELMLA